jgi:hypothetical protein
MDLEELSKLWSVLLQTPHALSTTWSASVVLLEENETVLPSLPVTAPVLSVTPLRRPRIDRVEAATDPTLPITGDQTIRISGSQLHADGALVRVGVIELASAGGTDTTVEVDLSTAPLELRAGAVPIQVVHPWLVGTPPGQRGETASNVAAIALHPLITDNPSFAADSIEVEVAPAVGSRQRAVLELLDPTTGVVARMAPVPDRAADATALAVPVTGLAIGTYGVRLLVDGVASLVERDAAGTISFPTVTVP